MEKIIKWFENVWYHYKFHIICVVFFAMFLAIVTAQMMSKEEIDISILYTGPDYITSEIPSMKNAFIQTMSCDYNSDGEKVVQITDITLLTDEQLAQRAKDAAAIGEKFLYDPSDIQDAKNKFELEIFSGEAIICLVDEHWFDYVNESSGFLPLEEALGYKPDNIINEYGVYLKEIAFGQFYTVFDNLPDNTVLCIRRMTTTTIFKSTRKEETRYEYHLQMFKDIFDFKLKEDTSI